VAVVRARASGPASAPPQQTGQAAVKPSAALCWMHLFPTGACDFDTRGPGSLAARDSECCVALRHTGPAAADIEIEAGAGLKLWLGRCGRPGVGDRGSAALRRRAGPLPAARSPRPQEVMYVKPSAWSLDNSATPLGTTSFEAAS